VAHCEDPAVSLDFYSTTPVVIVIATSNTTPYGWDSEMRRLRNQIAVVASSFSSFTLTSRDESQRGPLYGWYQEFQPWPRVHERARSVAQPLPLRRPQARSCRIDQRRWKRRRFLHALRRSA
jgi:hypothetical protein